MRGGLEKMRLDLKHLFRNAVSRAVAAGLLAALAPVCVPDGAAAGCCPREGDGAFRMSHPLSCAAMLHQDAADFALCPMAAKERPRPFAPRRPFQPEAENFRAVLPGIARRRAAPAVRSEADRLPRSFQAAFPIRAGPSPA